MATAARGRSATNSVTPKQCTIQIADSAIAIRSKYLDELIGSTVIPAQRGPRAYHGLGWIYCF